MLSIVLRALAVLALFGGVGLAMWMPWSGPPPGEPVPAADVAVDGPPGRPVDDLAVTAPHELVRYEMPPAKAPPPLPEGVADLSFADLWEDGEFTLDVTESERIGRPSAAEFPAGTTAQDIELFFLDIGDMRDMQARYGSVRDELDGKRVRLAGYTTPVGFAEGETRFLLVPELGACIHVPPPPPNQIVYVEKAAGEPEMFAPVFVTGTLKAAPVGTVLADVGYQLVDVVAEPYR